MRFPPIRLIGGGAVLAAAMTGLIAAAAPPGVSAGGITLVSPTVQLDADATPFPDGPHADAVNENCLACHSASMALTQPRLNAAQWRAIVEKMRDVYKAPVQPSAIPDIVAYLTAASAQQAPAPAR